MVFNENGGAPNIAVCVERLSRTFGFEFFEVAKNLEMCLIDGAEIFSIPLEQEGKCSHIVEYQTHEEGREQPFGGEVLQKKVVVVAKV